MSDKTIPISFCPICKKTILWTIENNFRPFCSQRCQLIDLGEWITESYKINDNEENNLDK